MLSKWSGLRTLKMMTEQRKHRIANDRSGTNSTLIQEIKRKVCVKDKNNIKKSRLMTIRNDERNTFTI